MASLNSIVGGRDQWPIAVGEYYDFAPILIDDFSSTTIGGDIIFFVPMFLNSDQSFDRISAFNNNDANGISLRLGLYEDNNGLPGDLVFEAPEITIADSNTQTRRAAIIDQSLRYGRYWFAFVASASINAYLWPPPGGSAPRPWLQPSDNASINRLPTQSHTYAALPSSAAPDGYQVSPPSITLRTA